MNRNSQDKLVVFILAAFCLVLYINSLWNIFVFDDLHTIRDNFYIKHPRYFPAFFKGLYSSEPIPKGMFRPLLLISFAFNYFFNGLKPFGYHVINVTLHFLNGIMLYFFLRFLKKDTPFGLSLILSLLFIAHPLNSEAVNYITCRSDLLVTFFIISAFICYAKNRLFLGVFLFILSLLSKETALVFPFLIFMYDFILGAPQQKSVLQQLKKKRTLYIVFFGIGIFYWLYRSIIFSLPSSLSVPAHAPPRSLVANILTQSAVTLFYLKLFIWPQPLNIHHSFPAIYSFFNPLPLISLVALCIMIFLVFILRKKYPIIAFSLSWYLVSLLPKFYAILNFPAMEHHSYLPSIGLYLLLAALTQVLYLKFRRGFIYAAVGILSIFSVLVFFRNYEWKNSFNLYKTSADRNPASAVAHNNLGLEYMHMGLNDKAEEEFRKSMSLSKDLGAQVNPRGNLVAIYRKQGKFKEAIELVNEMLKMLPDDASVYQTLGTIYIAMENERKAEEVWKKGLSFNSTSSAIDLYLGILYLRQGRREEARKYLQAAITYNPDMYLSYFSLGILLEQEGDVKSAIKAYEKSIDLKPDYAISRYLLGKLYAKNSDVRALRHLKEAVKLDPKLAEAYNDLAVLYASIIPPRMELSRENAQKALSLGYKVEKSFLKIISFPDPN